MGRLDGGCITIEHLKLILDCRCSRNEAVYVTISQSDDKLLCSPFRLDDTSCRCVREVGVLRILITAIKTN